MRIRHHAILLVTTLSLAACSSDSPYNPAPEEERVPIGFDVAVSSRISDGTRASETGEEDVDSFILYGSTSSYNLINGEKAIKAHDGSWTTPRPYYWPENSYDPLRFLAYHPTDIEGWKFPSGSYVSHIDRIYYRPPQSAADQVDIVIATTDAINYATTPQKHVRLDFRHILTEVVFTLDGAYGTLESITLKNVYAGGGFNPKTDIWDTRKENQYLGDEELTDYTIPAPPDGVFGDEHRLMIVPQKTPESCEIVLKFKDGSVRSTNFQFMELRKGEIERINITVSK